MYKEGLQKQDVLAALRYNANAITNNATKWQDVRRETGNGCRR